MPGSSVPAEKVKAKIGAVALFSLESFVIDSSEVEQSYVAVLYFRQVLVGQRLSCNVPGYENAGSAGCGVCLIKLPINIDRFRFGVIIDDWLESFLDLCNELLLSNFLPMKSDRCVSSEDKNALRWSSPNVFVIHIRRPQCRVPFIVLKEVGRSVNNHVRSIFYLKGFSGIYKRLTSRVGSAFGGIGSPLHFTPLKSGIICIDGDGRKRENRDSGSYTKSIAFFCIPVALVVGYVGFGLVYSAGSIKEKIAFGVPQIAVDIAYLIAAWVATHVASIC